MTEARSIDVLRVSSWAGSIIKAPPVLPDGCIQDGDALIRKDSAHHRRDPARQLRSRQRMEVDGLFIGIIYV